MSPFKVQEKKEFSLTNTSNTNGSTGKVKISDQFLSKINQNKPVIETKAASSPVKSNTNKFDNSFSPKNDHSENEKTQSIQQQQQKQQQETKKEPEQFTAPLSPVPSSFTNGSNGSNGFSNTTPKQATFSPPMYKESDEDDEWGDNANDPLQILPTHSAPLASFNEDYQEDYQSPFQTQQVICFKYYLLIKNALTITINFRFK